MAPSQKITVISAVILAVLLEVCYVVESDPNTTVESVSCNIMSYSDDDPFAMSLAYVIAGLENVAPSRPGYDYYISSPYPTAVAYGHATCNQNLANSDCSTCLSAAKAAMLSSCENRIGAQAVLYDCAIRYEQYQFSN